MARRRSRRQGSPRPLGGVAPDADRRLWAGREYWVRAIPGAMAGKPYVCPLCGDSIPAGEPHVVVWPADERAGLEQRRHWHTRCWRRRG